MTLPLVLDCICPSIGQYNSYSYSYTILDVLLYYFKRGSTFFYKDRQVSQHSCITISLS
jgi:hypothetical protein